MDLTYQWITKSCDSLRQHQENFICILYAYCVFLNTSTRTASRCAIKCAVISPIMPKENWQPAILLEFLHTVPEKAHNMIENLRYHLNCDLTVYRLF